MKLLSFLPLLLSLPAHAALTDFLVFSKTSIQSHSSDYQGPVGAMGRVELTHFEVNGDLKAGASISLTDGTIRGMASAPIIDLRRATSRGQRRANENYFLQGASADLDSLALRLSALAPTQAASATGSTLLIQTSGETTVVDLDVNLFNAATILRLEGSGLLLIRVSGTAISFSQKAVQLGGNLHANQVVFFFPDARSLELSRSGGAVDPISGVALGVPGSIVAPKALVHFSEILVTGQLYVGQICSELGVSGGQVNGGRSLLLDLVSRGCGNFSCR